MVAGLLDYRHSGALSKIVLSPQSSHVQRPTMIATSDTRYNASIRVTEALEVAESYLKALDAADMMSGSNLGDEQVGLSLSNFKTCSSCYNSTPASKLAVMPLQTNSDIPDDISRHDPIQHDVH
jgi:hypothetical protein